MKEIDLNEKELRMYRSLVNEVEAKFRHINKGSYQTKYRYLEALRLFSRVMVTGFHKNNLNRIRVKHIQYFADYMKENGYSNSSITTNMSGIRFYFDQVSAGKLYIPTNKELGIVSRSKAERINVNRSMPNEQYNELINIAESMGRQDLVLKLKLGYEIGLRIHEIIGIRSSDVKKTLKQFDTCQLEVVLKVKGKTGRIRSVSVDKCIQIDLLREVLEYGKGKDDRIFVEGKQMHLLIKDFQRFIRDNRDENAEYKVTAHSLRHSYAKNEYTVLKGTMSEHSLKLKIAENLGHGRASITEVYIDDVDEWN